MLLTLPTEKKEDPKRKPIDIICYNNHQSNIIIFNKSSIRLTWAVLT